MDAEEGNRHEGQWTWILSQSRAMHSLFSSAQLSKPAASLTETGHVGETRTMGVSAGALEGLLEEGLSAKVAEAVETLANKHLGASSQNFAGQYLMNFVNLSALATAQVVPRPLSAFDPASPMPSSECVFWMLSRFWDGYWDLGRAGLVQRRPFVPDFNGPAAPLLWAMLWGTSVRSTGRSNFNRTDGNGIGWHPELDGRSKHAIVERARTVLVGALYSAMDEMQSSSLVSGGDPANNRTQLLSSARKIVPVLQSLVLGMLYSEQSGDSRVMVALASLSVRMAKSAALALKGWVALCVGRLTSRPMLSPIPGEGHFMDDWFYQEGIVPVVRASESLSASLAVDGLSDDEEEEVLLLAEFCASYYFCFGLEIWAADLMGTGWAFNWSERSER